MNYNWAIYKYIVFLSKDYKSNRLFADTHNIDEGTFRDIENAWRNNEDYQISLPTIYRICQAKNISIYKFFSEVERVKDLVVEK